MVQRKAPHRWLGSQAELKINSHVNTSKPNSQQQDLGSRVGGGGDLKKKMKLERSIIAAELDSLQGLKNSSTTTKRPNYMKPTSSSKSRTETPQVKRNPKPSKPSKKASKGTVVQRGVVVVSRATCSSTLKGSTFPKALDLAPGGTEAEGTSATRVCPYAYCSLNGHGHEPLPPLRRFVSARRRLLKTQKSTKLRALSSFNVNRVEEEEMEIDTGQKALANDFFVQIYTTKPGEQSKPEVLADGEHGEDEHANDPYSDVSSEVSDEDVDVATNFLEYVECDRPVEEEEEEEDDAATDGKDTLSLVQVGSCSGSAELHTESREVDTSGEGGAEAEKASTSVLGWEDDEERPFPENKAELSELEAGDDELLPPEVEDEDDTNEELCGLDISNPNSNAYEPESSEEDHSKNDIVQGDDPDVQEILVFESTEEEDWAEEVEDSSSLSIAQLFDSYDDLSELEQAAAEGDRVQDSAYDGQSENKHQEELFNLEESIDGMKARMRITMKKKMSEDLEEETKEFNPRGPRFLPAEPDPEAEKVDLRHQMMDERKNSEEWMIDYALRRAVMKLAPAPKKKVAVLVEAFETVAPLPAWGKARRHSTPGGFSHARIIQACS